MENGLFFSRALDSTGTMSARSRASLSRGRTIGAETAIFMGSTVSRNDFA
jgi:hypothetical protein